MATKKTTKTKRTQIQDLAVEAQKLTGGEAQKVRGGDSTPTKPKPTGAGNKPPLIGNTGPEV